MHTTLIPPTTGKKKKARRVFGDAAADDLDCSLTYSPSPLKNESLKTASESLNGTNKGRFSPVDEPNVSHKVTDLSSVSGNSTAQEKENMFTVNTETTTKSVQQRVRNICAFSHSPLRPDLVKKTQEAITRANTSMKNFSQTLAAGRQAKIDYVNYRRKETSDVHKNWKTETTEAKTLSELTAQNRRNFLSLQRQFASKYSQEKVKREHSQRREMLNLIENEIQLKSAVFRDQQSKLKKVEDDRRRHSAVARAKIRANNKLGERYLRQEKIKEEQAVFEERHVTSIALKDTMELNRSHRRKSFAFRHGDARRIRLLHASWEKQLRQQEHENYMLKWQAANDVDQHIRMEFRARRESLANRNASGRTLRELESKRVQNILSNEHENYELKWASERDAKNYVRSQENERRQSLQQRNLEGNRHRKLLQKQHADKLCQEQAMIELKWAGEKDAEGHRHELEQARRESLVFRNKEGKRHRDFAQNEQNNLARQSHEDYELKWAGERDAKAYLAKMDMERRDSFANRNMDARRRRALTRQALVEVSKCEHDSYELKRAASKDAEEYVRQQEKFRRESLQGRNKERAQLSKVMEELRMLALEKESESYALKWAAENDTKEYLAKLDEERRLSLQRRGQQSMHHRQVDHEQKAKQLKKLQEDEVLRADDQREVALYTKQCTDRDRASFEYRRKDARIQRINDEDSLRTHREEENQSLKLETLARMDVVEYINDCKKRRRMSLACRAKEKRKQAEWLRDNKRKERDENSRRAHDQRMDQKYIELAQQKERARLALNAIRHAGYSLK
jgi:hypothetical protein